MLFTLKRKTTNSNLFWDFHYTCNLTSAISAIGHTELISEKTYKYRIILQAGILEKSITNFFSGKIVQKENEKELKEISVCNS